jgi:uncharacterized coiled-coil protein SlyX
MKAKIRNAEELDGAIAELELKAAEQKKGIQETFKVVSENLKPINLVKSGFRSVFSAEKKDLVNILLGLGSGFLSRKLFVGKPTGAIGKTVGKAIQWGMAGLVSKNAEKIKQKAGELIDKIFKRSKTGSNHTPTSVSFPERKEIIP